MDKCNFCNVTLWCNCAFTTFFISNVQLDKKSETRDLGVVLALTLSFIPHITSICKNTLSMLGFLKKNTSALKNIDYFVYTDTLHFYKL
jgi:hypothetical protein